MLINTSPMYMFMFHYPVLERLEKHSDFGNHNNLSNTVVIKKRSETVLS